MQKGKQGARSSGGRFLRPEDRIPPAPRPGTRKLGRYLAVTVLLLGDGLLIYMILHCLIVPVYGAVFVAAVSVTIGYQINQEV